MSEKIAPPLQTVVNHGFFHVADEMTTSCSLADCLPALDNIEITMPGLQTVANVTVAKEDSVKELSADGINSQRFDYREHRLISHSPPPQPTAAGLAMVPRPGIANVCHVPICYPANSWTYDNITPVVLGLTGLEDKFAASVLASIDAKPDDATHAPIDGLLCRVAQAILCAETGATAALAPNVPDWDVRVAELKNSGTHRNIYPNHVPVFLPHDIGKPAAEALVSLLLPGGAAAYGWRFRGIALGSGAAAPPTPSPPDPRAAYMPSYARKLYPGGDTEILLITEKAARPDVGWQFGGGALDLPRLAQLEAWLRRRFGDDMMDAAFKTMAAFGHVYLEPVADGTNLGDSFDVYRTTVVHGGNDLSGDVFDWHPGNPPPGNIAVRHGDINIDRRPGDFDTIIYDTARQLWPGNAPAGGGTHPWGPFNLPIGNFTHPEYLLENDEVQFNWHVGNQHRSLSIPMGELLQHVAAPNNGVRREVRQYAAALIQQASGALINLYDGAQDLSSIAPLATLRNAFGYSDSCAFALPYFNLRAVTSALAGVHHVAVKRGHGSVLDRCNRRERLRHYIAKMHVGHVFANIGSNVWPDMLDIAGIKHKQLVVRLPKGLQPMTYLEDGGRDKLDAPNWQILEVVSRLKGTKNSTAFYGYNVPGTWDVTQDGIVNVNSGASSFAALDACLRSMWMWGSTASVTTAMADSFRPIRDEANLIAPAGFAPVACGRARNGRLVDITLARGPTGCDMLAFGKNHNFDTIFAG